MSEPDHGKFKLLVLIGALAIRIAWPIHLGYQLTKWVLHFGWSIAIANLAVSTQGGRRHDL